MPEHATLSSVEHVVSLEEPPDRKAGRLTGLSIRHWVGFTVVMAGLALLTLEVQRRIAADSQMTGALIGGLMAAAATALGTLPMLLSQRISQRIADGLLGFGAGVMLAASAFSLVIPALQAARDQGAGSWGAALLVGAGILLGAAFLVAADHWVPQQTFLRNGDGLVKADSARGKALRRAWLFVAAISLHNMPEGLAIGVGFAGGDAARAHALTAGISIQDIPEGLVVALALRGVGYSRGVSVMYGAASGLIEPVMAVLGAAAITVSAHLLPWALAFAAGAMLLAVAHEAIPGSHEQGNAKTATSGLICGFVLMMMLDTVLG